jgi:hypothetical protein
MSVEKKIAELMAESKKLQHQEEILETHVETHKELEQGAAKTIQAKGSPGGEGDNADNKRNQGTEKPEVKTSKDTSLKAGSSEADSKSAPSVKKEEISYDSSEDVAALVEGEELSEEFKTKAATIFEAAVVTRVKAELAKIQEQYDAQLVEEFEQIKEELVDKVDGYLGYIAEQWIKQNELALESGIKAELAESFIQGMKRVFEEHYVDVPSEKYDILGSLESQVEALEGKLNETVTANIEMAKQIAEMQRSGIVAELSEGLTDTEQEKFATLAAEIACEDVDTYTKKLQTIRESYFKEAKPVAKPDSSAAPASEQMISESVAQYAQAISKLKK